MDKRNVFRSLTIAGVVGFTLLVILVFIRQQRIAGEARDLVEHTYSVHKQIEDVFIKVKDLELGQRGFLFSGDSSYLQPYHRALHGRSDTPGVFQGASRADDPLTVWDHFRILDRLLVDNPVQVARADTLEALVHRRVEYADSVIHMRATSGLEAAVIYAKGGEGKRIMDSTRALVWDMLAEEEKLLAERLLLEGKHQRANSLLLYSIVGLFYLAWLVSLRWAGKAKARRQQAESKMREANRRLDAVIHGIDYGVFVADSRGSLRIFSRGAERMLGYKAADFVGKPVMEVTGKMFLPGELEARAGRIVQQYGRPPEGIEIFNLPLEGDGPLGQEWTNVRADGSHLTVAVSVWELRGEDGEPQGSVAMARDITAIKEVERMKREFVSTVSHELRTPLTSIRGALGLVAGGAVGPLPDGAREMISIAHRNSERLVHIINDILDIDKIESGRLALYPKPLEVAGFLQGALEANLPYGEKHGVRFELGAVPGDAWVTADPERLMQVMANLLSNAAKFSPQGAAVRVEVERHAATLRISVCDEGPGIPEAFRARVFEKFAQAEGNDSRRYEGTGLGLNITRKLVEAMHGNIGFETKTGPGKTGTVFWFELPLGSAPAAASAPTPVETFAGTRTGGRVLICEDDADVGAFLKLLLAGAGLESDVVSTIAGARARLSKGHYAALTLDLMLPDGSGLTLLRELRRDPATENLPVIVVSARAEEGREELHGDAVGMVDWLGKPIQETALVDALRRAVKGTDRPRILHVEDDADFREILARSLRDAAEWSGAATLREAEALLNGARFDLVVLDLDLPDGSGLQLLERLKNAPGGPVPVLILSASETDDDVRQKVEAALVKSRLSEERIVETILAQIHKSSQKKGTQA